MSPKNTDVEFNLDALMEKVRAAANAGDTVAGILAADTQDASNGEPLDIFQVISAQVEWNNQTTKTLSAVADCLRHLQTELTAFQGSLASHATLDTAPGEPGLPHRRKRKRARRAARRRARRR